MKYASFILLICLIITGCAVNSHTDPVTASEVNSCTSPRTQMLNWGYYYLEIARDGSWVRVSPNRSANVAWGYHINAVKLLEVSPCTDCLSTSNVHVLANGDVSVDITLIHPWPHDNLFCTGFDVRGIIMFQASQLFPDNDLRALAGLEPYGDGKWRERYSSHLKGDPELMNPDGWTSIWAPDAIGTMDYQIEEGLPIFDYYPGKYATADNLASINAYRNFRTNENRHMFEVGKSDTRTYIIRPPETGNIQASYAVHAYWAPPTNTPVTNPAEDFPPEANSPSPYEFRVVQLAPVDPDVPIIEQGKDILYFVKSWDIGNEYWHGCFLDLLYEVAGGFHFFPYDGDYYKGCEEPDCPGCFMSLGYALIEDGLPGEWPYLFELHVEDPDWHLGDPWLSTDWYICNIEIEAPDGEW